MNETEKKAIGEIKDNLIKLTKTLSDMLEVETHGMEGEQLEDWMKNRVEFWCRIYNEGGVVSKEKAHNIWEKQLGKDARGFGGFFVGKGASLQRTANEQIVLTSNASDAIEAWTGKTIEDYAKKFKKPKEDK